MDRLKEWQDIKNVLSGNQIADDAGMKSLEVLFDEMSTQPQLLDVVLGNATSSLGNRSDVFKPRRDLFRAYNFLTAVRDAIQYRLDETLKDAAHSGTKSEAELLVAVKKVYEQIKLKQQALTPPTPIPTPGGKPTVSSPPTPSLGPVRASTRVFEIALGYRGGPRVRNIALEANHAATRKAAELFIKGGVRSAMGIGATQRRPQDINMKLQVTQFSAEANTAWSDAYTKIKLHFMQQQIDFWNQSVNPIQSAIRDAYDNVNITVFKNQERLQNRIDLVKKCFEALSDAPPPFSYIGEIGSQIAGVVHSAEYNPTIKYTAWKGDDGSKLMAGVAELMEGFEKCTQLGTTPELPKQADVDAVFHEVNRNYMETMKKIVDGVTDMLFGQDHATRQKKLQAFKETYAQQVGLGGGGFEQHRNTMIDQVTREFKDDVIEKISKAFKPIQRFRQEEMRIAIELWLLSHLVAGYWPNNSYTIDLDGGIVNFFAHPHEFQVIDTDVKDHEASAGRHHLNWKGGENHKRALQLFCRWYVYQVNPFHMATGVMRNGKPYNGSTIKELCLTQIDTINRSIALGRKLNFLGMSSWDWNIIYNAYEQFVNADHPGNQYVEAFSSNEDFFVNG